MKTYIINLIRHGMTDEMIEGKYIGHTDAKLSEDGITQLNQLKEIYKYPDSPIVFSSSLTRCTDTARLLFPDAKILAVNDLIEYNFGEFEGKTADELHVEEPLFDRWLRGEDIAPPFGETNAEFSARVCGAFSKICDAQIEAGYDEITIVTHGGIIMTIMAAFAIPEAALTDWVTPTGCGYSLRLDPSLWARCRKLEAFREIPVEVDEGNYYDGWDYYPESLYDEE